MPASNQASTSEVNSSAAMTRSKNKRPPNAFLGKSFDGRPAALELQEVPRLAFCFSFSPIPILLYAVASPR